MGPEDRIVEAVWRDRVKEVDAPLGESVMPFIAMAPIASVSAPETTVAVAEVVAWDSGPEETKARSFRSGPYTLHLGVAATRQPLEPSRDPVPLGRLTIVETDTSSGRSPLTLTAPETAVGTAYLSLAVARLDAGAPSFAVVMTGYTGGAHCCQDVQVAVPTGGGWTVLHPGAFDNAPLGDGGTHLEDLDGDGAAELVIPDDRFDYVFACFACTHQPVRVFGLRGAVLVDRSMEPGFRPVLQADMDRAGALCRGGEPGACPGYLADAARLGRWDEAWRVVRASIAAQPSAGYPHHLCAGLRVEDRCRPGETDQRIPDYYASVRLALRWRGYPVPTGG